MLARGQDDPGWRLTRFDGKVTLGLGREGERANFFPCKHVGYFDSHTKD